MVASYPPPLYSKQPCKVEKAERDSDWPKIIQGTLWPSGSLNLGFPSWSKNLTTKHNTCSHSCEIHVFFSGYVCLLLYACHPTLHNHIKENLQSNKLPYIVPPYLNIKTDLVLLRLLFLKLFAIHVIANICPLPSEPSAPESLSLPTSKKTFLDLELIHPHTCAPPHTFSPFP